jgi:hypothetical protein
MPFDIEEEHTMCGVQIGASELESVIASARGNGLAEAACGVQIGADELAQVVAHNRANAANESACGIQIGAEAAEQ